MNHTLLIENLLEGGIAHDKALSTLFKNKELKTDLFNFFKSKGLSIDICETLWTDLIIQFGYLVQQGKYKEEGKLLGFLKNLGRYLVLNHFRDLKKDRLDFNLEDIDFPSEIETLPIYKKELRRLLVNELNLLGKTCKEILLLWAAKYSMIEIQTKLKLISPEATRKRKHSCFKKLLTNIEANASIAKELKQFL